MQGSNYHGKPQVIRKLLVSGTIVLGAAIGLAAPAGADPDFNNLRCSCRAPDSITSPVFDHQIHQGIQDAFDLAAVPGQHAPPH
jgi:hypothetical protein